MISTFPGSAGIHLSIKSKVRTFCDFSRSHRPQQIFDSYPAFARNGVWSGSTREGLSSERTCSTRSMREETPNFP